MKRLIPLLLCLVLLLPLVPSVSAAQLKIVDNAGLLTEDEAAYLEKKAQALADAYDIDVIIVTVWSLDGKTIEEYADDYFDDNGYGIGSDSSGVLLLLSMEYRDWAISTYGNGAYALTDYGIQRIFSQIAGYLSNQEYYQAFDAYLDTLESYFQAYSLGKPIDGYAGQYDGPGTYAPGTREDVVYYHPSRISFGFVVKQLLIALAIGAVAGGIVLFCLRSQMRTAVPQSDAGCYLKSGSYELRRNQDIFLYSNITKVRRAENNGGGGGGGHRGGGGSSVHTSSSGRSHGGGHGKF